MDIALVIDASMRTAGDLETLTRPFGESSLLEIALEKLANLDAPCKKYAFYNEPRARAVIRNHGQLKPLSLRHAEKIQAGQGPIGRSLLDAMSESWVFCINPRYPLVNEEVWWQAIDHFLALEPLGLISASPCLGQLFPSDAQHPVLELNAGNTLLSNGAFCLSTKKAIETNRAIWPNNFADFMPFEIASDTNWSVANCRDFVAVEALYSRDQLGLVV